MKSDKLHKRDRTRPRPAKLTPREIWHRDRMRASALKWAGLPPGMSPALARKFEQSLEDDKTIKDLTAPQSSFYLVPESRFKKHCEINPAWAQNIFELNKASITKKRKTTSGHGLARKKFCLRGLHRMTKDNVLIDGVGHRRCKACRYTSMAGKPMTAEMVDQIKEAIINGASFGQICHGAPIGGGPVDRSLVITSAAKFQRQRKLDPDFDALVNKHFASSNIIGQIARHVRRGHKKENTNSVLPPEMKPTVIAIGRLRHRLRTMAGGKYARSLKRQDEKRYRKRFKPELSN